MVVELGDTVMLLPVPKTVPPHDPANHCGVAPVPANPPVRVNVVLLPLQIVVVPVMPVGATDNVLTVTITGDVGASAAPPQVEATRLYHRVFVRPAGGSYVAPVAPPIVVHEPPLSSLYCQ